MQPSIPSATAAPITIEFGRLRLAVDHEHGGSLLGLEYRPPHDDGRWLRVISRNVPGEEPASKPPSFTMAPWTNRIRDARFTFRGVTHRLRVSSADGTAIHGDVRARPWAIIDRTPVSASLGFDSRRFADVNFPFPFTSKIRFDLSTGALRIDLSVTNIGDNPIPAGCGIHPYFPRLLSGVDEPVEMTAPSTGRYPVNQSLPIGPAQRDKLTEHFAGLRPIPETEINDVFAGYGGWAKAVWPKSRVAMEMSSSPNLGHLVLFAPRNKAGGPEPYFAIEPLTMTNDGFNLMEKGWMGTGVAVLEPGQSLDTWITFAVGPA
ncbi:MAG: hypothetical protein ACREJO_11505 [Phycisphaerales bacterium]